MIYREYGRTGKKVSVIGAGCMRFDTPSKDADISAAADILLYAREMGVNYFDTAPLYCGDRSEEIVGRAVSQMEPGTFYVSTKCAADSGAELRASLERSLVRLGLDVIHFFHIWCLMNDDEWSRRKTGGAVEAALAAREEGLVEHVVFSTHMTGAETSAVIGEGLFEGVTLGYNAINFPYREEGVAAAGRAGLGVVVMNPLAGGIIPRHAERFAFLRGSRDPDVVTAALRFVASNPSVTSALVGVNSRSEVDAAVEAMKGFTPYDAEFLEGLKTQIQEQFDGLCTGCGYCLPCPVGIPIPKFMDVYNTYLLQDRQEVDFRFRLHWGIEPAGAAVCTSCGACEERCTQHLPIIERLRDITGF